MERQPQIGFEMNDGEAASDSVSVQMSMPEPKLKGTNANGGAMGENLGVPVPARGTVAPAPGFMDDGAATPSVGFRDSVVAPPSLGFKDQGRTMGQNPGVPVPAKDAVAPLSVGFKDDIAALPSPGFRNSVVAPPSLGFKDNFEERPSTGLKDQGTTMGQNPGMPGAAGASVPLGFEDQGRTMGQNPGVPVPAKDAVAPLAVGFKDDIAALPSPGFRNSVVAPPSLGFKDNFEERPSTGLKDQGPNSNTGSMDDITEIEVIQSEKKNGEEAKLPLCDFVLVYKEDKNDDKKAEKEKDRKAFEENLKNYEMIIDHEKSPDKETNYTKLHASWEVLAQMAKYTRTKVPIKSTGDNSGGNRPAKNPNCFSKIPFNPFTSSLKDIEENVYMDEFSDQREKSCRFTNAQRSYMVYELLLRTFYSDTDKRKKGIDRMIKNGIYTAAYPLHEGRYQFDESKTTRKQEMTDRQTLYDTWARPGRWYSYQPLNLIRKYFGEKIGMYFAWLGFYTVMLIPPSIIGVVVFFYGIASMFSHKPSEEICDESRAGNFTMCPLCDTDCDFWPLKTSCTYARLTYLFDNEATVFFACFMAIWASMFLEIWKRNETVLRYDWDVAGFKKEERLRSEYEEKVTEMKENPVSKKDEPYMPTWSKYSRRFTSIVAILFMVSLVVAAVIAIIVYEMIISAVLYATDSGVVHQNAKLVTTATAAVINLVAITILNKVYEHLAVFLTNLELPRTNTEYNDSFTFKMFLFQFIDYYSAIFYVAFFKGRLGGRPGQYDYIFGYRAEECDPAGCLIELCIQLGIVMIGDQAINNVMELFVPMVKNWYRKRKSTKKDEVEGSNRKQWEQDLDLTEQPPLGLFDEYLEMVVQYGFVTIFVAAFPLAPFFALLNNIIEIRLDAYKFVTVWKRPVALRAESIGIWFGILKSVSYFAVLTNAFIIAWTSDFVPKLVYKLTISSDKSLAGYIDYSLSYFDVNDFQNQSKPEVNITYCRYSNYRYHPNDEKKYELTTYYWHVLVARLAFVIVFEHCVFFLTRLVTLLIPDVPSSMRVLMLHERHLARKKYFHDLNPEANTSVSASYKKNN